MKDVLKRWSDLHVAVFEQRLILILLAVLVVVTLAIDRWSLSDMAAKLRAKEYILAPGSVDFATVRPQLIPDAYVKEFATIVARSLGCFTARDIEVQYHDLEKYMADDLRVDFRASTQATIKEMASHDVSELFTPATVDLAPPAPGGSSTFKAVVHGRLVRYVQSQKVSDESHVVELDLDGVAPSASAPWALRIVKFRRMPEDAYIKERTGRHP